MLEKLGYECFGKLVFIENDERITSLGPSNQIFVLPLFKKA